jgi:tetratricopeptide (TPR) repeat protein
MKKKSQERVEQLRQDGIDRIKHGLFEEGLKLYREALREAARHGDTQSQFQINCDIAIAYRKQERYPEALELLDTILKYNNDLRLQTIAYVELAIIHYHRMEYPAALAQLAKAEECERGLGDPKLRFYILNTYGAVHFFAGQHEQAELRFSQALVVSEREKHLRGLTTSVFNVGYCQVYRGEIQSGIKAMRRSLHHAREQQNDHAIAHAYKGLFFAHFKLEDFAKAREYASQALALSTQHGYNDIAAEVYYYLGKIHQIEEDEAVADACFNSVEKLDPRVPARFLKALDPSFAFVPATL